jgi:hypothetical protein
MSGSQRLALALTTLVLSAAVATAASRAAEVPGRLLLADGFEGDLSAWEANDESAVAIVDSGDAAHGRVLELNPSHSTLYALIRGSETWPAYRIEGEVLFPTNEHNYLGFVYNLRDVGGRIDLGSVYIKGNGSYIRVNPRRDWNPARMLYEEFRVALDGDAAIITGKWRRFAVEVEGAVCHLYVADMVTPKVTFPFFELDSGKAGFKPRVVGGPVWIDNVRATSITRLSYRGPMIPAGIEYRPERMVRDWKVLGPLQATHKELEQRAVPTSGGVIENGVAHLWREFQTDGRGAVVSGRVVDFLGEKTVAYFHSAIEVPQGSAAELEFSSIDDLTMWLNGKFEDYSYADDYAWHDFGVNPDHPSSPYASLPLAEGINHVLIRIRGGRYASGGFFAAVKTLR